MKTSREAALSLPIQRTTAVLSSLAGLIAVLTSYGWLRQDIRLLMPFGLEPMAFNSALGLLLGSAATITLLRRHYAATLCLGLLVGSLGLVYAIQYLGGWNFGIDDLIVSSSYLAAVQAEPAATLRMSPNAALCTSLLGISLVLHHHFWNWARLPVVASVLGGAVVVTGLTATLGYLFSVEAAYAWGQNPGMPPLASIGFSLLGGAMVAMSWRSQQQVGAFDLSSPIIALTVVLLSFNIATWVAMRDHETMKQRELLDTSLEHHASDILARLQTAMDATSRMGKRWESRLGESRANWESDATDYMLTLVGLQEIRWVDRSFRGRWRVERDVNAVIKQSDALMVELQHDAALRAINEKRAILSEVPVSRGTSPGFRVYRPLYVHDSFDGMIVATFDFDRFFSEIRREIDKEPSWLTLTTKGSKLYDLSRVSQLVSGTDWTTSRPIVAGGLNWRIEAGFASREALSQSHLPNLVLAAGLIISLLLIAAVQLLQRSRMLRRNLERDEHRFRTVVESAPNPMLVIDDSGVIQMINSETERMFGRSPDELINCSVEVLLPKRLRANHKSMRAGYDKRRSIRPMGAVRTLTAMHKDGTEIPVEIGLSPIEGESGPCVLASIVDVSERVRHIEELARSNEELERFAYVASHDLKAPLHAVDHLASWLEEDLEGKLDEKSSGHIRTMRSRIERMTRLLDDLLAYSRAGQIEDNAETVDTATLAREVFDMYCEDPAFKLRLASDLPVITTARAPLEMIFRNLFGNAIKHHDRAGGEIIVSACDAGEFVEFSIADDGPGIPAELVSRAFTMFVTLRRRDEVEGSGMGLAIIKRSIEALGGSISLHSRLPRGAEFRFRWPRVIQRELGRTKTSRNEPAASVASTTAAETKAEPLAESRRPTPRESVTA